MDERPPDGHQVTGLSSGPVQVAYGVDDVRSAAAQWVGIGAGPFFVREHIPVRDVRIGGIGAVFDHSSAYGQWGSLMVELVCVHEPSSLAGAGLHHLAFFVDSFDEASSALVSAGHAEVLSATAGDTRFAFHDGGDRFAHTIEIYEPSDALVGFYTMVRDAARDWNGTNPIRLIETR